MNNRFTVKGFSTRNKNAKRHQWKSYDNELIIENLLTHFNTRMGQRLGRPTYGCIIWDLWMEQSTSDMARNVEDEIKRVVSEEPRVELVSLTIIQTRHGLQCPLRLRSKINGEPWDLTIDFDARQGMATRG